MNSKSTLPLAALLATLGTAANAASFSKQVAVAAGDRVSISNVGGAVNITTWDRHEVDVQGELDTGIDRVDVHQEKGGVEFKVIARSGGWRNGGARLQIRVPADVLLETSTVSASLTVSGFPGRARLKSVSGEIRATAPGDSLDASSVSGNVQVSGGNAHSRSRAYTVSGNVVIGQGAGDVDARSTSGSVDATLAGADHVHLSTVSGNVTVRGNLSERGSLDLESVSGGLHITTQASGFRYEVSSYSGRVSSCFNDEVERSKHGGRTSIEGVRGSSGAFVMAKNHSGAVEICDR